MKFILYALVALALGLSRWRKVKIYNAVTKDLKSMTEEFKSISSVLNLDSSQKKIVEFKSRLKGA
jgi:hypothetical protein